MRLLPDWLGRRFVDVLPRWRPPGRSVWADVLAGSVATLVTLAHCLSYSALIFSGDLRDGLALGLWAFLAATSLGCLATAAATTLPPALAGPRNPAVAVMSVLAATVSGAVIAAGGDSAAAVLHVLVALSLATLLSGLIMWLLGAFRLGQAVRFIPYPVIAGFLAASGWLLIAGGARVALGRSFDWGTASTLGPADALRLAIAGGFGALLVALRGRGGTGALLPVLFIVVSGVLNGVLARSGETVGWFLPVTAATSPWSPLSLTLAESLDWRILAAATIEILSIAGVAAMSLMLDASSLEAQRRAMADVDREFKTAGIANLAAAAIGGFAIALAPNASRLIDELGGRRRLAGIAGGLVIGFVLLSGANLAAMVPTPVLGGLLIYLGYGVLAEALWRPQARPAMAELLLTLVIALTIVGAGYLAGIILGLVGACIVFALRYSRIDAVRRHLTRAVLTSPVDRDEATMQWLRHEGRRIHVFWLSGFIFFGSANRVYEQVLAAVGRRDRDERRWVILDVAAVSGLDAAAILSFVKLCGWAHENGVTLTLAGASRELVTEFERAGISSSTQWQFRAFADRGAALEWCEEELLRHAASTPRASPDDAIVRWLDGVLAPGAGARFVEQHLVRRSLAPGEVVCRQGEPSHSIEFVASGSVAVSVSDASGRSVRVRRMLGRTIIGEMGFLRAAPRAATVTADGPAVVYVLDRGSYERLAERDPTLARALLEFIARTLADRLELANREATALL